MYLCYLALSIRDLKSYSLAHEIPAGGIQKVCVKLAGARFTGPDERIADKEDPQCIRLFVPYFAIS